jgi:hypothetical protein
LILDSYRVVAPRESASTIKNRGHFAKQHRNNAAGKVFAAAAIPPRGGRALLRRVDAFNEATNRIRSDEAGSLVPACSPVFELEAF